MSRGSDSEIFENSAIIVLNREASDWSVSRCLPRHREQPSVKDATEMSRDFCGETSCLSQERF